MKVREKIVRSGMPLRAVRNEYIMNAFLMHSHHGMLAGVHISGIDFKYINLIYEHISMNSITMSHFLSTIKDR